MYRILKIGMDVHSTNYTLRAMEPILTAGDCVFANVKVTPKNSSMYKKYEQDDNKLLNSTKSITK